MARRAAAAALAEGTAPAGAVTVLLADDRELKRLNYQHRGRNKPTNVLSFPGALPGHAGDIALALGVVRREAAAAGRRPAAHLAHLVAHGTLHLLGHDHHSAGEARRMERAEARAMARLRLGNPWRSSAGGAA
ncbi:MAG TPA: rRNA maturation RNase YbeY [Crenalkalicoccus sp.]|nr:rRNA maturation RNase YbeY [Crenalkalicoccus sp.]